MGERGGGDQAIADGQRRFGSDAAPAIGHVIGERQHVIAEILPESVKPTLDDGSLERIFGPEALDALADFAEGNDAYKMPLAEGGCGPTTDSGIGLPALAHL